MLKQFPRQQETITAIQYDGTNLEVLKTSVKDANRIEMRKDSRLEVLTNHGWAVVAVNDWIIQKDDGEIYPCKNELFLKIADTKCTIPEHLPEHMKRVFVEQHQLEEKINALTTYIEKGLPHCSEKEARMLKRQCVHMQEYDAELSARLELYKQ